MDLATFVTGGSLIAVFSGVLVMLRSIPTKLFRLWVRRYTTEVELSSTDDAYYWFAQWLEGNEDMQKSRLLSASTQRRSRNNFDGPPATYGGHVELPELLFSPAVGMHFFRFRGKRIMLTRIREDGKDEMLGPKIERYYLRMLGDGRATVRSLLAECRDMARSDKDKYVSVRIKAYHGWTQAQRLPPRQIDSVVLDGMEQELLTDARWFADAESWYMARGVPYRRGYLFEGTPGSGKTSLVHALASELEWDVYVVNLNGCREDEFASLMSDIPPKSIMLLEDIDCSVDGRSVAMNANGKSEKAVSFSTVLNAIDGVVAGTGRIIVMTSNKAEELDEALVRPGRCDRSFKFMHATSTQARRLFELHYGRETSESLAESFGVLLKPGMSMAALQGLLMQNKDDPQGAIESLGMREVSTS